ncbi:MAG: iron-containing alcohol dehydrogenase [Gammaproteobacteria bacterium]|nr:iron-containing alcohol dehydrogenase [Gammaproteobacteria bacterium]
MQNFTLYNPVKIIFGKGQIAELANQIAKDKKVLITYGGGSIKKNGVYDQVMAALSGYTVMEFGGIEPNPKYETVMRAVQMIRENQIDFILAVGGGSVIDGTKFIAAAVNYEGDPWNMMTDSASIKSAIPFGTVLTLPAAGSEMNCGAVITRGQTKIPFMNPLVFPKFSVLDPETTTTLPPHQTANGVIDAFVHVIEQYITYDAKAPLQDRIAEGILQTLIVEGPKALKDHLDYDVRANIMWCSTMALNGLIAAGVPQDWATHLIGHEITAVYGLDHGQTLAIILPNIMAVKADKKRDKLVQYAERVWGVTDGTAEEKVEAAIAKTREFFESLGVKTRLSDYDVGEDSVARLIKQLEEHGRVAIGEHGDIDLKQSEEIIRRSL